MSIPFVHLHCHSDYSMLDGMATIKGYVERCQELGMKAIALTDHGNMHGVIEFHDACRKAGIKPIIGCEFYSTKDRTSRDLEDKYSHLILLAMDKEGRIRPAAQAQCDCMYRGQVVQTQDRRQGDKGELLTSDLSVRLHIGGSSETDPEG